MVIAVALTFYTGLALAVARLLSLNSRWERAVSALIAAEGAVAPAMSRAPGAEAAMTMPSSHRGERTSRPPAENATAVKSEAAASSVPDPATGAPEEEQQLVEVGF